jgi:hypothetical protein
MARSDRLDQLTRRWQARHAARRRQGVEAGLEREPAEPVRAARAAAAFPFRRVSPAEYVARHGSEMTAFTYDDYTYTDADLQAWLDEVGRLLRARPESPDR